MASLSNLPDEIIILIAEACDVPGKACLARANRRLNDLATVVLHRYSVQEEGNSALYWASEHGHINTLERMRSCGAELNDSSGSRLPVVCQRLARHLDPWHRATHAVGFLPLHVAARFGQDATVLWLLRHGARLESLAQNLCHCHDIGSRHSEAGLTWTPLHIAVCNNNLSTAKLLISRGAAIRSPRDEFSRQPDILQTAALCNNTAAIEFLVGSGLFDVDEPDSTGGVALHYACLRPGSLPAVKMLLDLGASQHTRELNRFGRTPLCLACEVGFFEAAVVLLDKGPPLDISETWYELKRMITQSYWRFSWRNSSPTLADGQERATWEEHRENFIRRLAQLGARSDGWRAMRPLELVLADDASLARTLQVFLDVGFDVNAKDFHGRTPIYMVLDVDVFRPTVASKVDLLLHYGARLDIYTDRGYCAFDRALQISRTTGDASVIDFIIQHGSVANFGVGYLDRVVAHSYASRLFNECRLLIGHGAALKIPDEQLYDDIRNGFDRKDLKQLNFHLDLFKDQITAPEMLEMAFEQYEDADGVATEVIKHLLDRLGIDSANPRDASWLLPKACKYHSNVAIAQLFLDRGAEVNSFDSKWETPLSYAVDIGCRPMIKYLLLHGADPHSAPSDQDWDNHVRKSPAGRYVKHLALGDSRYRTPFMRAIDSLDLHEDTHESCQADASNRLPSPLELILQHMQLPPMPQDPRSLSYVHYALAWPDSLRILLEKGADPNSGDHCTRPPLLHFLTLVEKLRPAKPEALRILLEFEADIHRTDGGGRSFLTMMRRCTLAMANNALFDAELENEKLGFAAGLLVRNLFITLDAKTGEDCVKPRPEAVADANCYEYLDRVAADFDRKRQLDLTGQRQQMGVVEGVQPLLASSFLWSPF
ncbi:hypothetical protein FJTKL_08598 [Diaporthe vaccinii]|uniref:Ankyrin repeat protein n=1 Tax=Diaporthe vaccinii TaxID=105482 RepID=A0ABR4ERL6_9PEZI